MKTVYLQDGQIITDVDKPVSGLFNLNKFVKRELTYLNIPLWDSCCSTLGTDPQPVRYSPTSGVLETYNGTIWTPATGSNIETSTTGITAHPGGGQGSAVALTTEYNEVTTVATAGDSVKLPTAVAGKRVIVKNAGVADLAIFPATADTIDEAGANASVTVPVGETLQFNGVNATNWETSEQTIGFGFGTALLPSITFAGDSDTGFYRQGANTIGLSLGGTEVAQFNSNQLSWLVGDVSAQGNLFGTNVVASGIFNGPAGTVGAPEYTFTGDLDTGMYHVGANQLGFAANGVLQTVIDTTGLKTSNLVELVGASGVQMTGKLITDKGTVTQITTKATTVVLNKSAGVITTVALTDAADTSFTFTLTNSLISATSVVTFGVLNSGNGIVNVSLVSIGSGTCVIRVANTGVAAFNSAIQIHFTVS